MLGRSSDVHEIGASRNSDGVHLGSVSSQLDRVDGRCKICTHAGASYHYDTYQYLHNQATCSDQQRGMRGGVGALSADRGACDKII